MAYATVNDFLDRFDSRVIGDLASEDGLNVPPGDLQDSSRLLTAIDDASGEIDAAVTIGQRYTPAQLATLTGVGLAYLKRICCEIAYYYLLTRCLRAVSPDRVEAAAKRYDDVLKMLSNGQRVFALDEPREAGLPLTIEPTSLDIDETRLIAGRARGHFYPVREAPGDY